MDERYALHNVILDNVHTHMLITAWMRDTFNAYRFKAIQFNLFYGEKSVLRYNTSKKKKSEFAGVSYCDVMNMVNQEESVAPSSEADQYFVQIDQTLQWLSATPQLYLHRVLYMMLFMYISVDLRNIIRRSTLATIGSVYFDGSDELPFKVEPYEKRFEQYLFGTAGPNKTTLIASKLPPLCVVEEVQLYMAICDYRDVVGFHSNPNHRGHRAPRS